MINRQNISAAWQQVKAKKSEGGIDRQSVETFEKNLDKNLDRISYLLQNNTYLPEAYLQIKIKKNKKEKRTLGLYRQ